MGRDGRLGRIRTGGQPLVLRRWQARDEAAVRILGVDGSSRRSPSATLSNAAASASLDGEVCMVTGSPGEPRHCVAGYRLKLIITINFERQPATSRSHDCDPSGARPPIAAITSSQRYRSMIHRYGGVSCTAPRGADETRHPPFVVRAFSLGSKRQIRGHGAEAGPTRFERGRGPATTLPFGLEGQRRKLARASSATSSPRPLMIARSV